MHFVFSTKNREPFLASAELRREMHSYLAGACKGSDSPAVEVGGAADHVHILCGLARDVSASDFIRELKKQSTRWIKMKGGGVAKFHWQRGFGAFSVSPAHVEAVREYIRSQDEHHIRESFQDEFRRLLGKYGIPCDEKYVWD